MIETFEQILLKEMHENKMISDENYTILYNHYSPLNNNEYRDYYYGNI